MIFAELLKVTGF